MDLNELDSELKRRDDYIKHSFQLLVTWFTFFVTVNWATMGWVAFSLKQVTETEFIRIVAGIFAWQSMLGLILCVVAIFYIRSQIIRLTELKPDQEEKGLFSSVTPGLLYQGSIVLMFLALLPVEIVWLLISMGYCLHK